MVAANEAEVLKEYGHHVVLFASGDSTANVDELVAVTPEAVRTMPDASINDNRLARYQFAMGRTVAELLRRPDIDIVHNHIGWQFLPFAEVIPQPVITTLHGRMDHVTERLGYGTYNSMPYVSVSQSQARQADGLGLNILGHAYNGIDIPQFRYGAHGSDEMALIGRICKEKGVDTAIWVAAESGRHLTIAAKVDPVDQQYFEDDIKPLLKKCAKYVDFVGEVGHDKKVSILGQVGVMLFPIRWDEPFGIVMAESLACGTPVAAFRRGSVPEVLSEDTALLCDTKEEMAEMINSKLSTIDRAACRHRAEVCYSREAMTDSYLTHFDTVLGLAA